MTELLSSAPEEQRSALTGWGIVKLVLCCLLLAGALGIVLFLNLRYGFMFSPGHE